MSTNIPPHQQPQNCYVCGRPDAEHVHPSGDGRRGYGQIGHKFWSNADALAEARDHDRRVRLTETPEARYVRQYRPY